jgi:peptidoglycan/xylan/chitin deacetylase (PgdA/CDA1 family)
MARRSAGEKAVTCLCRFIAALIVLLPVTAQAALIANPSAEQPGADKSQPAFWSPDHWGGTKATFTWQDGGYHGNKSLRVVLSSTKSGDAKWWSDNAKLTGQERLLITNHYRSDVPSVLLIRYSNSDAKTEFVKLAKLPAAASWTEASSESDVPSWASGLRVMQAISTPGWLEVDAWAATEVLGEPPIYPAADAKPKVSVTFDDGWLSAYELLFPLMKARGVRGSHFISTDTIDIAGARNGAGGPQRQMGSEHIKSQQIVELLAAKHEVGGHGIDHKDHRVMPLAQLVANLKISKSKLTALGADVAGYATPFGKYTEPVLTQLKQHYAYHRTRTAGINTKPYKAHELLAVVVDDEMTLLDFSKWVVKAAEKDAWLILIYQRAALSPTSESFVKPKLFAAQLDYLLKVGADIRPVGEVLDVWQAKPVVNTAPDIVTGQQLAAPDAVTKDPNYKDPTREVDGCGATARSRAAPASVLLLTLGFACLWWRRRPTSLTS